MLIRIVSYLQARDQLTNQQFADRIGIHKKSWQRIRRTGKFGIDFLKGVRRAYPELKDALDCYLAGEASNHNYYQTHYNGRGSPLRKLIRGLVRRIK